METLLQQECSTETQLETYKSQLGLVEEQLKVGASETDIADLSQLRENLSQLIALTEEALLDLKKQRLLLSLQPLNKDPTTAESGNLFSDEEQAREGREDGEGERGGSVYEEENDDLQGIKCQAPLKESWGAVNYHNAVILCREEESDEGEGEGGGVKVRVFFTHPTYNAMKPCPFHLDGMCKFKNTCKFSHGHVALFSELLTYQEPDYSLACVGGRCIAKYSDGLWYQAIISSFDEEFTVHIPSLNATLQTALENVFPLEGSESSESGASSESEIDEEEEVVVEWTPSGARRALGEWEKHTTGIGSKLMAKMGYVVGKGLGKRGEGRIEPVEIKILPAGKSLDMCAEMREKGKLRKAPGEEGGSGKRRKRRKRKLAEAAGLQETERERVNVFDFLNDKLRKNNSTDDIPVASRSKSKNLNVQFFTVQEEIKSVLKRRQSLKTQLARHKGKDKTMEAHVLEKLSSTDRELKRLQAEEQRIEKDIALKSERKKLRIF